jgi:hypothetical protein
MFYIRLLFTLTISVIALNSIAKEDKGKHIELETTTFKENTELPKTLYVVPWQDVSEEENKKEQRLVLHSLFNDVLEPIAPPAPKSVIK